MDSALKHVTVLEEVHNLLKRTSKDQSQEGANIVGKSVEMISNYIKEMRTYGEGFIIVDQSPMAVDVSAIENTSTKIIMNTPASLILQSMTQLEAMYSHAEATTIINNCDHIIYLGSQDLQTAEFIGNRIFKTPDTVLCTPRDKAIVIATGEKAVIADKIKPYSTLKI